MQRVISRYHHGGPREVLRAAISKLIGDSSYQEKLQHSFEERWRLVRSALPTDCESVLDVGSNLGAFTVRAANEGIFAVGIENDSLLVRRAKVIHAGAKRCAFMEANVDLALCAQLPDFDAILLLSVHHHWHHVFGAAKAAEMIKCMVRKAKRVLIFEGPSRSSRYESDIPNFADNEEESLLTYYDSYLEETVGALATGITRIGKAACVGEREPFRWMYAVVR